MPDSLTTRMRHVLEIALAFAPWVIAMYVLYWLQYGGIWTTETAHRGKISVAILMVGMALSFLARSHFLSRERK